VDHIPVNFTRTSSFCAGYVFIQPVRIKLPLNNNNVIYKSCGTYLMSVFIVRGVRLVKLSAMWWNVVVYSRSISSIQFN